MFIINKPQCDDMVSFNTETIPKAFGTAHVDYINYKTKLTNYSFKANKKASLIPIAPDSYRDEE